MGGRNFQPDGWIDHNDRLARNRAAPSGSLRFGAGSLALDSTPSNSAASAEPTPAPQSSVQQSDVGPKTADDDFNRHEALAWVVNARKEVLAVRAEKARAFEDEMAVLQARLDTALERAEFLENEKESLQNSLDLNVSENLELSRRLAESEAHSDEVSSDLQTSEMTCAERDLAAAAAERKIELLQNLVKVKEQRLQKLDQARKKLQQEAGKLLATTKARDKALADAENRIAILTELFEKLQLRFEATQTLEDASQEIGEAIERVVGPAPSRVRAQVASRVSSPAPAQVVSRPASHPAAQAAIPQPPRPIAMAPQPPVAMRESGPQARGWQRALDTDDWLLAGPSSRRN